MLLDLREIIQLPGGKVTFDVCPDLSALTGNSVKGIEGQARAQGYAANNAGLLTLNCRLSVQLQCICARCLKEFTLPLSKQITVNITERGDGEDPDGYFLNGDKIDLSEIIVTEMILSLDDKLLCIEDCAGLCHKCGTDLNNGKCCCEIEIDPRLAALQQLLSDN